MMMSRAAMLDYVGTLKAHLRQYGLWYLLAVFGIAVFQHYFLVGFNFVSPSLPGNVYIAIKGDHNLTRGDYVTFRWHGGGPWEEGLRFTKVVAGVPGDTVSMDADRNFYINGAFVGRAKTHSLKGAPLQPGLTGVIPPGRYYVMAPHYDSLDSRYALTGWIADQAIVGKTIMLF